MVATRLVSPCRVFLRRYLNAECLLEAFPFLAAGLLYVTTAARFVVGGDNGEFSTLMVTGGAAHPPGYPLYVLYLRAMRWLPAVSPAHRAALATSLLAAVGVFALQRACRAWGVSKPTAAVSATLYAFSPLAWYLGTHAEVFAVNALLAACILVLAGPHGPTRCATRSGLLGLVAGLGLANHHSIVLLAPVGLLATVQAIRQSERRAKALGAALLGLLIGLLPYLYLLGHGRTAAWSWGQTVDPTGLLFHFRRGEYGTTQLSLGNAAPEIGPHLIALAKTLVMGLLGVPIVAFALLIWSAFRKALPRTAGNERHATSHVGLVMSFLLCGPLFATRFNVPPDGLGASVAERFHLLPELVLTVLVAIAVDKTISKTVNTTRAVPAALAIVVIQTLFGFDKIRDSYGPSVEFYARNALFLAPRDAIIVGSGDHRLGTFLYARHALGLRTDVNYVDAYLLLNDWYRQRVSAAVNIALVSPVNHSLDLVAVVEQMAANDRPVLFTNVVPSKLFQTLPSYPIGPLIRMLPRGANPPSPTAVMREAEAAHRQMMLEPIPPRPNTWAGQMQEDYARPFITLAEVFGRIGDGPQRKTCLTLANSIAPWLTAGRR